MKENSMNERSGKAIVAQDGRSIEIMDAGRWVTIRLPFCVWDWAAVQRGGEAPVRFDDDDRLRG
jgi:hypothetical protein